MTNKVVLMAIIAFVLLSSFAVFDNEVQSDGTDEGIVDEGLEGAHSGQCGPSMYWDFGKIFSNELIIWGTGDMDDYSEDNPAPWYKFRTGIKSITIGLNNDYNNMRVHSIGDYAFANLTELESVQVLRWLNLDVELREIGDHAFYGCSSLRYFNAISESDNPLHVMYFSNLTTIGPHAFEGCSSMRIVNLGNAPITSVGEQAFIGCTSLETLSLSLSVSEVTDNQFAAVPAQKVMVPENIKTIGVQAFDGCTSMKQVVFDNPETTISERAFRGCTSLTDVNILKDLNTKIGECAFEGCISLPSLTVSDRMVSEGSSLIGNQAFKDCIGLKEFYVPITVEKSLRDTRMLAGCTGIETVYVTAGDHSPIIQMLQPKEYIWKDSPNCTVKLAKDISNIGMNQFYGCDGIKELVFECLVSTGGSSFENCKNLKTVVLSDDTELSSEDFKGCTALTNINLPKNLRFIPWGLFDGCTSLKIDVTVPSTVEYIRGYAFKDCLQIGKATIGCALVEEGAFMGSGVTSVEFTNDVDLRTNTFYGCERLSSVSFKANADVGANAFDSCTKLKSVNFEGFAKTGESSFQNCKDLGILKFGNVAEVGRSAFAYCISLSNVVFKGTADLDYEAFKGCTSLDTVSFPKKVTTKTGVFSNGAMKSITFYDQAIIGAFTFNHVLSLESVTFIGPATIEKEAFDGCANLVEVKFSDSSVSFETNCFRDCTSLRKVQMPIDVNLFPKSGLIFLNLGSLEELSLTTGASDGFDYSKEMAEAIWASLSGNVVKVTIGTGIETIGDYTFYGFKGLKEIVIPGHVREIGAHAFEGCPDLEKVTLEDGLKVIGDSAFSHCLKLNGVCDFSSAGKLTTICDDAFSGCSSISEIILPKSVNSLGAGAFSECTKLERVSYGSGVTVISERLFSGCTSLTFEIPLNTWKIGDKAFSGCTSLNVVKLPSCLKSLGSEAFFGDAGIASITIPDTVSSIGNRAFAGCTGLKTVVIGDSITWIDADCFAGCNNITSVKAPISLYLVPGGKPLFTSTVISSFTISVGSGIGIDYNDNNCRLLPWASSNDKMVLTIQEGVTSIGEWMFAYTDSTDGIVIPDTVKEIGRSAFYENGLKWVQLGYNMYAIEDGAFYGCEKLEKVLNKSWINLECGSDAYGGVAKYATEMSSAHNLGYQDEYVLTYSDIDDTCMIISYTGSETDLVLPHSFTIDGIIYHNLSIGTEAFRDRYIESLTIPESYVFIEEHAFQNCRGLKSIEFKGGTAVSPHAFDVADAPDWMVLSKGMEISPMAFNKLFLINDLEVCGDELAGYTWVYDGIYYQIDNDDDHPESSIDVFIEKVEELVQTVVEAIRNIMRAIFKPIFGGLGLLR